MSAVINAEYPMLLDYLTFGNQPPNGLRYLRVGGRR